MLDRHFGSHCIERGRATSDGDTAGPACIQIKRFATTWVADVIRRIVDQIVRCFGTSLFVDPRADNGPESPKCALWIDGAYHIMHGSGIVWSTTFGTILALEDNMGQMLPRPQYRERPRVPPIFSECSRHLR